MKHSMQILKEAAKKYGPLCVGLDTDPLYIPENIRKNYSSDADAVLAYNLGLIERIKKEEKQKEEEAKRLAQEAAKAKEQESSDSNEENK